MSPSDGYAARWEDRKDLYRRSFFLRSDAGEWKEIYRDTGCDTPFYSANFLTDSQLAIVSCYRLTVMDTEGKVSFTDDFPANRPPETRIIVSTDGRRFAISLGESKGVENAFLDLAAMRFPGVCWSTRRGPAKRCLVLR